jgi:hypothetical protein
MTRGRQARRRSGKCAHDATVSVVSAGIERIICESCGLVGVSYQSALDGAIDRRAFARDADQLSDPESLVFAATADTLTKPLVTAGTS